jgi:hypothetical protein
MELSYWSRASLQERNPYSRCSRERRIKSARMAVFETAARVRIVFAAACPEVGLFGQLATGLTPVGPINHGAVIPVKGGMALERPEVTERGFL